MSAPNLAELALEIYQRGRSTHLPEHEFRQWLAAKLGLVYQQGVVDGIDQGRLALDAAFAKIRAKP